MPFSPGIWRGHSQSLQSKYIAQRDPKSQAMKGFASIQPVKPPGDKVCFRRAPCKGGAVQWVQAPPGDSLQPEATGAVMEVTKWLKPSTSGHNRGLCECAGRNASERRANPEKVD